MKIKQVQYTNSMLHEEEAIKCTLVKHGWQMYSADLGRRILLDVNNVHGKNWDFSIVKDEKEVEGPFMSTPLASEAFLIWKPKTQFAREIAAVHKFCRDNETEREVHTIYNIPSNEYGLDVKEPQPTPPSVTAKKEQTGPTGQPSYL